MNNDNQAKSKELLWWITSIATSVLCCSVLFIFFASYLVDLRTTERDNNARIDVIEQRENKILTELELIRKHAEAISAPAAVPAAPVVDGTGAVVTPPAPDAQGSMNAMPGAVAPSSTTGSAPMPHVEVPVVAPPADKK